MTTLAVPLGANNYEIIHRFLANTEQEMSCPSAGKVGIEDGSSCCHLGCCGVAVGQGVAAAVCREAAFLGVLGTSCCECMRSRARQSWQSPAGANDSQAAADAGCTHHQAIVSHLATAHCLIELLPAPHLAAV